jgi:hypothetical protein
MVDSRWSLSLDLLSAKVLVWVAKAGRDAELTPDAHLYFFDRYTRLAELYRARGGLSKASRLQAKAREHYPGDGGPPYAAAMAMSRPTRLIKTNAVGKSRLDGPPDAA